MHPFFRYGGMGNAGNSNHPSRRDSSARSKSPTGSYDEEDEEEVASGSNKRQSSTAPKITIQGVPMEQPTKKKHADVPIIKVEDEVIFRGKPKTDKTGGSENRKRLGPNKNNIILETLQKDLKSVK